MYAQQARQRVLNGERRHAEAGNGNHLGRIAQLTFEAPDRARFPALRLADVPHDVKTYARVGHSFMNRHDGWARVVDRVPGVGYDQDTAADAWRRIDAFLDRHLRGAD